MAAFDFMGGMMAAKAASTTGRINPGVHSAKFVKIEKSTLDTKNGPSEVMALTIDLEGHGEYTQNFFKPTSTERTDGMYGPQPSQMEQFQILVREILEALNPEFAQDIESGALKLSGNFAQIVKALGEYAKNFVGVEFKVKFMPQSNGYSSIPSFVAAVARDGKTLRISNVVIGKNVSLTASEERKIKAVEVAKPTEMPATTDNSDLLSGVMSDIKAEESEDDLPF